MPASNRSRTPTPRSTLRPRHSRRQERYRHWIRRPLHALVFVAPLLVFFHVGVGLYGTQLLAPQLVRRFLEFFGASVGFLPALIIPAILLILHLARGDRWRIHPLAVAGMAGESALSVLPLLALTWLIGGRSATASTAQAPGWLQDSLQAVGAGLYEEFVFRLVLMGLLLLLLVDLLELNKEVSAVAAVLISAVLFSLAHFRLSAGLGGAMEFHWGEFVFLALAGAYWGTLYLVRGFGVAVGAHVCWDLYVLLAAG